MAQIVTQWFKLETLKTLAETLEKKGLTGVEITSSIRAEGDQYGQNVWSFVSQSKEERDAKKNRFTVANGRTVWSNNNEPVFRYQDGKDKTRTSNQSQDNSDDDFPF